MAHPPSPSRKSHPLRSLFSLPLFHHPPLPKTKQVHINLDPARVSSSDPSLLSLTGQDPHRPSLSSPLTQALSSSSSSLQLDGVGRIVSNKVVTTQYSILTFLPKNLYHQFRRVANFFFLMIVILQCIGPFQSMEPAVSALPLMIIVGLTAARDGFEDWKRHEVDQTVNTRKTLALHNWKNRTMEQKLAHHHHRRHRSKYARYLYQDSTTTGTLSRASRQQSKRSWITERTLIIGRIMKQFFRSLFKCIRYVYRSWTRTVRKVRARLLHDPESMERRLQDTNHELDLSDSEHQERAPEVIGYSYRCHSTGRNPEEPQPGELYQITEEPPENDLSYPYWRPRLWQEVQEGDMILLRRNDFIPADLLILSSSEPEPICYVETMNLDGETNLKIRQCVPGVGPLYTPEECSRIKFWVDSEGPNNNLLKYHGAVVFPSDPESGAGSRRVGIDLNHLLLRGCVLRNTEWVIGLVIFTGADTKLQMNSGRVPSKRSDMERKMNFQM